MKATALKIEDLGMNEMEAARIVAAFVQFAKDLGYRDYRIDELECRSRSGFIPNSHNKGGISCVAFMMQSIARMNRTGFKKADKTLDEYFEYNLKDFAECNKVSTDTDMWDEKTWEAFYDVEDNDSEATVLFGFDLMYTGKVGTKHTANLRFTVCVKDAPYHRYYDDLLSLDIDWTFHNELLAKFKKILKRKPVKIFMDNVEEAY